MCDFDVDIKDFLNYDQWRLSWYAYLDLLQIDYEDGFTCSTSGPVPDIVVCDATSLGFQRKFASSAFPKEILAKSKRIRRFS